MNFIKSIIFAGGLLFILLISACSSHIPPEIKQPLEGSPSVTAVRDRADAYISQKVRWGGVILQTENKDDASRLTIVAFPLSDDAEPRTSEHSPGRFIAVFNQFMEPTVYSKDREITVTGNLLRTETLDVGEFPYEYPVIQVEQHYLWPVRDESTYHDYPPYWWYDPWYPYYPYYYPYYPHHRR